MPAVFSGIELYKYYVKGILKLWASFERGVDLNLFRKLSCLTWTKT
jgi:hypothetical protein